MIPALVLGGLVLGALVGWHARRTLDRGPRGWVVLFPDLRSAAMAWSPGATVYYLDEHGVRALTEREVSRALLERMQRG